MDTNTPTGAAETSPRFKRGDVVRLNSGAPLMTVQEPAMDEEDTALIAELNKPTQGDD